tara:strand:- start:662 stop:853 length:192 start_codon:yes stop_codon:yes gene_type:complete
MTKKRAPLKQVDFLVEEGIAFAHGGRRKNAGRKKTAEKTRVMRVPESLVATVNKLIEDHKKKS